MIASISSDYVVVAKDYLQTPKGVQKMVLKPTLQAMNWVKLSGLELSSDASRVQSIFKGTNKFVGWLDLPKKIDKFCKALLKFKERFFSGSPTQIFYSSTEVYTSSVSLAGLLGSSLKLANSEKVISLSERQLSWINVLGVLGSVSLVITSIKGLHKQVGILRENPELEVKRLALMRLVCKVLDVTVGCIGIFTFTLGTALAVKWILLSLSTTLLALSIATHFYSEIHVKPLEPPFFEGCKQQQNLVAL